MRLGKAKLRSAGIGAVLTHGEHRKHGYLSKTAVASLESAREAGYDFSILFGIPDFYHKFGYSRAWNNTHYKISLDNLPKEKPKHSVKRLKKSQYSETEKLYNKITKNLTGTAVRPTYSFYDKKEQGYCWTDESGKITGYVFVKPQPNELECIEAIGDVEQIFRVAVLIAKKALVKNINFSFLHYELPIAKALRRKNCTTETHYQACGGPMAKIVNLRSTLQKMEVELSERIKQSLIPNYKGELLISSAEEKVNLKIAHGKVFVSDNSKTKNFIKGDYRLVELIFGTDEPFETAEATGIKFGGDGKELAGILFPSRHPQQLIRDYF
jgi:predicted acetyltransferase